MAEVLGATPDESELIGPPPLPRDLADMYRFAELTGPGLVDAPTKLQDRYLNLNSEEKIEFQRIDRELGEFRPVRFVASMYEHPRASIGTFFLSLTALTADIERSDFSPKIVLAQIGAIAAFNIVGKKLKV